MVDVAEALLADPDGASIKASEIMRSILPEPIRFLEDEAGQGDQRPLMDLTVGSHPLAPARFLG
jgi:hypothetical protein